MAGLESRLESGCLINNIAAESRSSAALASQGQNSTGGPAMSIIGGVWRVEVRRLGEG